MNIKHEIMLLLSIVLICCAGTVCAADSNNTVDMVCDVDSNEEFTSISKYELADDVEESVLSTKKEKSNNVTVDGEKLSLSNEDSLAVTAQETNQYLNDIKTTTSDEFYKFVDYLIKQKGFKFNAKNSDDGYTIYSSSNYQSILFDGENYVLPAGTPYFISKNRISYVLDEYYPDVLYFKNNDVYVDELYLGWLKNVENYHMTFNDGGLNNVFTIDSSQSSSQSTSSNLPKAYDLRDYGYVSPVKNQFNSGNCWAFASIAALESFLLKNEGKTNDFSAMYDFSENNVKNLVSSIGRQGVSFFSVNNGGRTAMALAYFLRWSGPVSEELDKYMIDINRNVVSNTPNEFPSEKHVQGIKYIHARNGPKDNDEIKQAIMDYGAVVTSMTMIQKYPYLDENNVNYYYDGVPIQIDSDGETLMHEVCIVGWNDDYKAKNFAKTPIGDGAFIVKNSWGPDWGDKGYFYVSYYDTCFAHFPEFEINNAVGFVFTSVQDKLNYDINYQYTPLGTTFWFNSNSKSVRYRNNWNASSNEWLRACGVYVDGPVDCSVEVFVNNDNVNSVAKQEIKLNYAGFHTINFDNPVKLTKDQKFRIQVTLNSQNYIFVPVERLVVAPNSIGEIVYIYNESSSHVGESEIFEDGVWKDITTKYWNANLCLNAYSDFYPMITKFDVSDLTMNAGENKNIVATLYDKNNNVVKNAQITISINGVTVVGVTNDNGQVSFPFTMSVGVYNVNFNFNGNDLYVGVSKTISVTVNQVTVVVPPQSQPPVSSPTTNIPNNPVVTKPTSTVTVLKIIYTNKKFSPIENVDLTLRPEKSLKVTVKGNNIKQQIPFKNGKGSLLLNKFKLKNKKAYSFNFAYSSDKYLLKQTIKITTK